MVLCSSLPIAFVTRLDAFNVASSGSEVPSGSSAVYHTRRLGRDLMWLTWAVTAEAFIYVLTTIDMNICRAPLSCKWDDELSHVIHQIETGFLHFVENLIEYYVRLSKVGIGCTYDHVDFPWGNNKTVIKSENTADHSESRWTLSVMT